MSEEVKKVTADTESVTVAAPEAKPVDPVEAKIREYDGDDATVAAIKNLGVETIDDLAMLSEKELTGAGIKLIKARRLMTELRKAPEPTASEKVAASAMAFPADYNSILPAVPDGGSWLNSLRLGGVLKVDPTTYIAAIRAALADRCGLYRIPDKLVDLMETYADESDEPVSDLFFQLRDQITKRDYAELFSATKGLTGAFATKKRREMFLSRVGDDLWTAIREAYVQLDAWYNSMMAAQNNPNALFSTISGILSGGSVGVGLNVPPTDGVRDAGDTLKDAINHVFRGTGAPVAAALALDAMEIVKVLDNRDLPAMVGVANRDQMLRKLGVNISPNYARLEQNLVRFVLSYIEFSDNGAANEVQYLSSLWQLGAQINWDSLIGKSGTGVSNIGGKRVL